MKKSLRPNQLPSHEMEIEVPRIHGAEYLDQALAQFVKELPSAPPERPLPY
jgi:hypothetical protein